MEFSDAEENRRVDRFELDVPDHYTPVSSIQSRSARFQQIQFTNIHALGSSRTGTVCIRDNTVRDTGLDQYSSMLDSIWLWFTELAS